MRARPVVVGVIAIAALVVASCAPSIEHVRDRARRDAESRLHARRETRAPSGDDGAPPAEVRRMLRGMLSSDDAVRIALLNNRELVAAFGDVGVARGELVDASSIPSPVVEDATIRFPLEGDDDPTIELAAVLGLTETLLLPLRRGAADAAMEAAAVELTGATLTLAFSTRRAFVEYQAAEQALAGRRVVLESAAAALEAATMLREAGNVTEVDWLGERAFHEEARLAVSRAETEVVEARERLNVAMGLFGRDTRWRAHRALPPPAHHETSLAHVERRAIERSLDLEASRLRIVAAARHTTFARVAGLVPDVEAGVSAERDHGIWSIGPTVRVSLPIFGAGRGRAIAAGARLDRLRAGHVALAVRIRSAARLVRARVEGARARAIHARGVIVPLRREIVAGRLRELNAMQIGLFVLLDAQRSSVEAEMRAVDELRDYWVARIELEELLAGRLPAMDAGARVDARGGSSVAAEGSDRGGH